MKRIKIDSYGDNKLKVKKIGGLKNVKIITLEDSIKLNFKPEAIGYIIEIIRSNIEEYGNIFEDIKIDEEIMISKMKLINDGENLCYLSITLTFTDHHYFDVIKWQQPYILSEYLPDDWYLFQEVDRGNETDEEPK